MEILKLQPGMGLRASQVGWTPDGWGKCTKDVDLKKKGSGAIHPTTLARNPEMGAIILLIAESMADGKRDCQVNQQLFVDEGWALASDLEWSKGTLYVGGANSF